MTTDIFNKEFEGISAQLKSYILRITASIADAEDVVQETYLKALDKLHSFRGDSSLKTWVFTIASNLAKDNKKAQKRWTENVLDISKEAALKNKTFFQQAMHIRMNSPQGQYEAKEHIAFCFTCIYRACFKPQLPRFFIERLTRPGEVVYDPFMGRGTTPIEAALLGRIRWGNDANPLSVMTAPRLHPPTLPEVEARLAAVALDAAVPCPDDLLVFYDPETLRAICSLRQYLLERQKTGQADRVDDWIGLVALNRLTGHSNGFFSVYTLPPNQAVSVKSQRRINERRNQTPLRRDVRRIILKKSRILLRDLEAGEARATLARVAAQARLVTGPADATPQLPPDSVALVVTSPPFLNVVQYATDNWLRCWFMGLFR